MPRSKQALLWTKYIPLTKSQRDYLDRRRCQHRPPATRLRPTDCCPEAAEEARWSELIRVEEIQVAVLVP